MSQSLVGARILGKSVGVAVLALFFGLPLVWMVVTAFAPTATLAWTPPTHVTLQNFTAVSHQAGMWLSFGNSFYIAFGSAALATALAALAGYPLSRFRFRGRLVYMLAMLFITGLPVTSLMVPLFEMYARLNWLNSRFAVLLVLAALAVPVSIWLIKTFLDTIDPALEEAAWVDGCTRWQAFLRVILPLARPGILVVLILNVLAGWGNFYVPFILLTSTNKFPAAVMMYTFFGAAGLVNYGHLAAFSILYAIPVIVLYLLSGGKFGQTLNVGGVKG
jgi:multiple sugar transport system permease protein